MIKGPNSKDPSKGFDENNIEVPGAETLDGYEKPFDASAKALNELTSRELSRRRLLPFVLKFNPTYMAGWCHKDICRRLERFSDDVAAKKSPRLMIFMPPRSGKSELASRSFPAWHLGRHPEHEIIATSYAGSLALKFSRKVRSIIRDSKFLRIFKGVTLDTDSQSAENWLLKEGGGYMAAGVSGPLTGNGMHIGIIDDPVKNREEAESETVREGIKDWYTSTFYTRLAPGAGILVILTRWHDDDLAGWLLEEEKKGGDEWDVVSYPAIAEEDELFRNKGDALHPDRYDQKAFGKIRRAIGERDWWALYQQKPTADDGDYFKKEDFKLYRPGDCPPLNELAIYQAWDLAIGQKQDNDFSVGITVGLDREERIWVLDVVRGKFDGREIVEKIIDLYEKYTPQYVGIEKGHISMSIGPFLNQRIRERRAYGLVPEELTVGRADKVLRARSIQGRMKQGTVFFPEHETWFMALRDELLRFPAGKHDDQVDAMAWLGRMLDLFIPLSPKRVVVPKSWKDKLSQYVQKTSSGRGTMSA